MFLHCCQFHERKIYRLQLFSFHGHCPRKDHHGNLFTSFIAFYGLIPSSTIYAWYVNTNMVPIFQKINELWDLSTPGVMGVREFELKCADTVSDEMFSITFLLHGKSSQNVAM